MEFDKALALSTAKEYVQQNNHQAAIEVFRKIIEADPGDLPSISALGELYVRANRVEDAVREFSRLADGYIASGFMRKAIAVLKKIMAIDPRNTVCWIKLADVYAKAGLPTEARQHYLQIAEAYRRNAQTREALEVYGKVVDLDPSNASARIKLGELYLRERMNDQAYEAFIAAAAQLATRGERRRALNAYNEALAIRPDSAEALAALNKLTEGHDGLSNKPALTAALGNSLVEAAMSSGNLDPIVASMPPNRVAEELDSALVVHEISKAEILVAYGQVDQAIAMLKGVAARFPDTIDVRIKLKDIYLRNGMTAEGAAECRELERIHRALGEDTRARDYALRAIRLTQLIEQPSGDLRGSGPEPVQEPVPPTVAPPLAPAMLRDVAPVPVRPVSQVQSPPPAVSQVQSPPPAVSQVQAPPPVVSQAQSSPLVVAQVQSAPEVSQVQSPPSAVSEVQAQPVPQAKEVQSAPLQVLGDVQSLPEPAASPVHSAPVPVVTQVQSTPVPVARQIQSIPVPLRPLRRPQGTQEPRPVVTSKIPEGVATLVAESPSAAPMNFVLPDAETGLAPLPTERSIQEAEVRSDDPSLSALTKVAITSPMAVKKPARFKMAALAAGVVAVLGTGAVIGGFVFDKKLNKQYEELTMVAPPETAQSEAAQPEAAASTPAGTESSPAGDSLTVVVTPRDKPDQPSRQETPGVKPARAEQPAPAPAPKETAKEAARPLPPAPSPPHAAVNPDSRAVGENRIPAGVPAGVPTGALGSAPAPVEPPAKPSRVSEGVVLGGAIRKVEPGYPAGARVARQSGTVRVEVSIDERGNVTSARALSGPSLFQNTAVMAARGWKFKPSTIGGAPVKTTTVIVFNFKL
ncbi:MAG TPA: TonB family protein [Blastocatellia bacterium]|nr:TonB family protein [Blastocatellia bacterium]